MSLRRFLRLAAVAIIFIAVVSTAYVGWRYISVPSELDVTDASSFAALQPVKCVFGAGNFEGSINGIMYVAHGNVRADYVATFRGQSATYHLILRKDTEGHALWTDEGENVPLIVPSVTESNSDCSPWWFPDDMYFTAPQDVAFTAY
jgi:hypothetical protein